jgi:RNA polymerase sigma factor (sigma-70 family)
MFSPLVASNHAVAILLGPIVATLLPERNFRARAVTSVSKETELESSRIERAKAGDRAAFQALYVATRENVFRLVFRMGIGSADLDDVVQEVFVQVYRSLKDFRGGAKFSTWVHRVAVNVVLMHRRAKRSRPILAHQREHEPMPEIEQHQDLPDAEVDRNRRVRAFARILAGLSEKKRDVFVLHDLEGMAPAEISKIVGAPVLTVRTRLFYARRELEELMKTEPALSGFSESLSAHTSGDSL